MTHHVLSRLPILGKFVDERFLEYRRRSTSIGGIVGGLVAIGLFEYRLFHDHQFTWDLVAVVLTIVTVKLSLMFWYRFNG